jgi:hypothetical protein
MSLAARVHASKVAAKKIVEQDGKLKDERMR